MTEIALPSSYAVLLGKITSLVCGRIPDQQEAHPANNKDRIFRNVPTDEIITCKLLGEVCFHLVQATHDKRRSNLWRCILHDPVAQQCWDPKGVKG